MLSKSTLLAACVSHLVKTPGYGHGVSAKEAEEGALFYFTHSYPSMKELALYLYCAGLMSLGESYKYGTAPVSPVSAKVYGTMYETMSSSFL
jgi:hypothetical protein